MKEKPPDKGEKKTDTNPDVVGPNYPQEKHDYPIQVTDRDDGEVYLIDELQTKFKPDIPPDQGK